MITVVAVAAAVAWAVRRVVRHRRGSAARQAARQLPPVAAALARSVRTGASLPTALADVAGGAGPGLVGQELRSVLDAVDRGRSLDGALADWQDRSVVDGVPLLVGACRFSADHGGDPARALDGVAASLLDALEVADETRALVSQARTSATVLALLPPFGAAAFALADPAVAGVLFGTAAGWACVVVGLGLDGLGAWISGRLVGAALR
jgi:tight adherence protein B